MRVAPSLIASALAALVAAGCSKAAPRSAPAPASPIAPASAAAASPVAARRAALAALLDEHWQWRMKTWPEWASMLGDLRYNDRWSDASLEEDQREVAAQRAFLARFQALDLRGLDEQD